jgi:hypothetical protein
VRLIHLEIEDGHQYHQDHPEEETTEKEEKPEKNHGGNFGIKTTRVL